MPVAEFKTGTTMTRPGAKWSGTAGEAQGRGVGRAMGSYLFALLLLVALGWLVRPELALLTSGWQQVLALVGLVTAGLLTWLWPAHPAAAGPAPVEPAEVAAPPLSDAAQASIAVLPLENLSGTAEDAVVAQGFSAEIVRALSGVPDLRIVPFLQSASYAGRKRTDVARELNFRYVLAGSLQRAASRVRVIATLTDAASGQHAWSESYERNIDDLFQVQRELAE